MADVNYVITIDDKDLLKGLSDMKKGFNGVGDAAKKTQSQVDSSLGKAGNKVSEVEKNFKKASSESLSFWKVAGGAAVGGLALGVIEGLASSFASLIPKLVEVTAKYQKYQAVLTNSLGSQALANQALSDLVDFAAKTPFQIDELTDSFIKYTNRGLKPTQAEMTKLGDLAATTGKDFGQLTEAVLDATTGEFERLKEFGIKASQAGDKVSLSFKNQTVVVEKNSEAVRQAIIAFGGLQGVAGSMDAISKTLGGTLSNLEDNTEQLLKTIGDAFAPAFSFAASTISDLTSGIKNLINSQEDQIQTSVESAAQAKREAVNGIELLNRYEELTAKGIKPTKEQKEELTSITYSLRDAFGESVVSIDKETGALTLNTEAVKTAIKQKLLLSNQEASTLALKLQNVKDNLRADNVELASREKSVKRLRELLKLAGAEFPTIDKGGRIVSDSNSEKRGELTTQRQFERAATERIEANKKLKDLFIKGLADLGFKEEDASLENLIKTATDAANKIDKITGTNFGSGGGGKSGKSDAQKAAEELEKAYQSLADSVDKSNLEQLTGFEKIKQETTLNIEEVDKLQATMEGLAKAAGKTLSADAIDGLQTLRDNAYAEGVAALNDYNNELIAKTKEANKKLSDAEKERREKVKKDLEDVYSFLLDDAVKRVDLINVSGDKELTLEEYKERKKLEIQLKYLKLELERLQNDPLQEERKLAIQTQIDLYQNEFDKKPPPKKKDKDKPSFIEQFLIDQFDIDQSEAAAIISTVQSSIGQIYNSIAQSQIAATDAAIAENQRLLESLNSRVDIVKAAIDTEYANAAKGSANMLQLKKNEYDKLKIQQEKAASDAEVLRKKRLREQVNADTISQASSLITSSANIVQSFSALPLGIGIGLSAFVIGAMFAAFAVNRAKAYEIANQSAAEGGAMTQYLNGKTDKQGQRAYIVVNDKGESVLNLGGNEYIMNSSASSKYRPELEAMNKGTYKHRGIGEGAERRVHSIEVQRYAVAAEKEQMNYNEMELRFMKVMDKNFQDYMKFQSKKPKIIPTKDGYIEISGNLTKKVKM